MHDISLSHFRVHHDKLKLLFSKKRWSGKCFVVSHGNSIYHTMWLALRVCVVVAGFHLHVGLRFNN